MPFKQYGVFVMKKIKKLTPSLLKRIIFEEKQKLISLGIIKNKKSSNVERKKMLKELALVQKQQEDAVKLFKKLFEKKQRLKKRIKRR